MLWKYSHKHKISIYYNPHPLESPRPILILLPYRFYPVWSSWPVEMTMPLPPIFNHGYASVDQPLYCICHRHEMSASCHLRRLSVFEIDFHLRRYSSVIGFTLRYGSLTSRSSRFSEDLLDFQKILWIFQEIFWIFQAIFWIQTSYTYWSQLIANIFLAEFSSSLYK